MVVRRKLWASPGPRSIPLSGDLNPTCRCPTSPFRVRREGSTAAGICADPVAIPAQVEPDRLATRGRQLATQYRDTLARIEKELGVPGSVVLAIWARETDYGGYQLPNDAIPVLATGLRR